MPNSSTDYESSTDYSTDSAAHAHSYYGANIHTASNSSISGALTIAHICPDSSPDPATHASAVSAAHTCPYASPDVLADAASD